MPPDSVLRVLVIDDDRLVSRVVLRVLRSCQVDLADNARVALELARERPYDVVLCDLSMPDLSGEEVLTQLRRDATGLEKRFILMTGGAITDAAIARVAALQVPVLEKPMTAERLWAAVRGVLSPAQLERFGP
ncbi:MAG: response regulator [Myxococcaceae bacterium]|nr:response regulator [Myxococcaceae bacterium]